VFTYALLPHACGFSAEAVIRPAYELNVHPTVYRAAADIAVPAPLAGVDVPNVIVESVKWAEEGHAFVMRLYEAERTATCTRLRFGTVPEKVSETNLLEEHAKPLPLTDAMVELHFRPFEIKTLRCVYSAE